MNEPHPIPPEPPPSQTGWHPSGSTIGSGAGGALAIVVVAITQHVAQVTLDAVTVSAITTLCSTLAGYFFDGGRK